MGKPGNPQPAKQPANRQRTNKPRPATNNQVTLRQCRQRAPYRVRRSESGNSNLESLSLTKTTKTISIGGGRLKWKNLPADRRGGHLSGPISTSRSKNGEACQLRVVLLRYAWRISGVTASRRKKRTEAPSWRWRLSIYETGRVSFNQRGVWRFAGGAGRAGLRRDGRLRIQSSVEKTGSRPEERGDVRKHRGKGKRNRFPNLFGPQGDRL